MQNKMQNDKLEDATSCNRHKTAPAKVLAVLVTSAKTLLVQQACSQDPALQKALAFSVKNQHCMELFIFDIFVYVL